MMELGLMSASPTAPASSAAAPASPAGASSATQPRAHVRRGPAVQAPSTPLTQPWDYLIVSAANDAQAAAYDAQLRLRRRLGYLADTRDVRVVPDPDGQRVGSGGSTVACLLGVLNAELAGHGGDPADPAVWWEILSRLRILIVHGGGDSQRLPAYGPCGKVFVPVPGESDRAVPETLFDRQLPTYLALPPTRPGSGQVVIASGDVLLTFDPSQVRFDAEGIVGLGCLASPEQASRHGVYCADADGRVRCFLQKPSPAQQAERGAIDRYGQSILDIGVLSFDAATAAALLEACGAAPLEDGTLACDGSMADAIRTCGLDFYREVCCAMGTEA